MTLSELPVQLLNANLQAWLLRARRGKARRRATALRLRRHTNRHGFTGVVISGQVQRPKPADKRRVKIELPAWLDLESNYDETITHLVRVRKAAQGKFRLGYLSFERIRHISPSAALLLASEIDRWKSAVSDRVSADHKTWHPAVCRLLCDMGFFELLKLKRPDDVPRVENTRFLPFIRGNVEDRGDKSGRQAQLLRQSIEDAAGVQIRKHLLFAGLSEAITNVSQHAYAKGRDGPGTKPWWMSAALHDGCVVVSFYDHGRTIPGTLPASKPFEHLKESMLAWHDGERIKAAMEMGRTSTGSPRRGKGLQNFLELINAHPASELRIFSKRGLLVAKNAAGGTLSFTCTELRTCLRGTLIEWQFAPTNA